MTHDFTSQFMANQPTPPKVPTPRFTRVYTVIAGLMKQWVFNGFHEGLKKQGRPSGGGLRQGVGWLAIINFIWEISFTGEGYHYKIEPPKKYQGFFRRNE